MVMTRYLSNFPTFKAVFFLMLCYTICMYNITHNDGSNIASPNSIFTQKINYQIFFKPGQIVDCGHVKITTMIPTPAYKNGKPYIFTAF